MNDEAGTLVDFVAKHYAIIGSFIALIFAIGEAKFRQKDHGRRIKALEESQGAMSTRLETKVDNVQDKLEKLMFYLMEKK